MVPVGLEGIDHIVALAALPLVESHLSISIVRLALELAGNVYRPNPSG